MATQGKTLKHPRNTVLVGGLDTTDPNAPVLVPLLVGPTGALLSIATISAGDIEIGAVELKDGATDARAKIVVMTGIASSDIGIAVADPIAAGLLTTLSANQGTQITAEQAIASDLGTTVDAPVADNTTVASATAATGTGLWKRLVNLGIAILAKQPSLGTATAPSANVVTTQNPAMTEVRSTALEASKVLKNAAGQLKQLTVFNSKASAQFILLMNSATVPGDGAVTLLFPPIPIGAASILVLDFPSPLVASTGIAVSNSSTGTFTKTIGSADCVFYAQVN